jgi:hypothetical protein
MVVCQHCKEIFRSTRSLDAHLKASSHCQRAALAKLLEQSQELLLRAVASSRDNEDNGMDNQDSIANADESVAPSHESSIREQDYSDESMEEETPGVECGESMEEETSGLESSDASSLRDSDTTMSSQTSRTLSDDVSSNNSMDAQPSAESSMRGGGGASNYNAEADDDYDDNGLAGSFPFSAATNAFSTFPLPRDYAAESRPLFSTRASFEFSPLEDTKISGNRARKAPSGGTLVARPLAPSTLGVTNVPAPSEPMRGFLHQNDAATQQVKSASSKTRAVTEAENKDSSSPSEKPQMKRHKTDPEGWGNTFADWNKNMWQCSTCCIWSDESRNTCPSCKAERHEAITSSVAGAVGGTGSTAGRGGFSFSTGGGASGPTTRRDGGGGGFSFGNTSSFGGASAFSFGAAVHPLATATTKPAFSFGNATATSNGTLGTTTAKTSGFTFGSVASEDSDPVEKLVKDGTSAKEAKHQDGASADAMQSEEHSTQAEENSDS